MQSYDTNTAVSITDDGRTNGILPQHQRCPSQSDRRGRWRYVWRIDRRLASKSAAVLWPGFHQAEAIILLAVGIPVRYGKTDF